MHDKYMQMFEGQGDGVLGEYLANLGKNRGVYVKFFVFGVSLIK